MTLDDTDFRLRGYVAVRQRGHGAVDGRSGQLIAFGQSGLRPLIADQFPAGVLIKAGPGICPVVVLIQGHFITDRSLTVHQLHGNTGRTLSAISDRERTVYAGVFDL